MTNNILFVLPCMTAATVIPILLSEYTTDNNITLAKSIAEQEEQFLQQTQTKKLTTQNYLHTFITQLTAIQTRTEDAGSPTISSSSSSSSSIPPLPRIFKQVEDSVVQ